MDLCDALRRQLVTERPETVLEALDVLGPNPEAAAFFAGTSHKSDPAYKAALRRVQRYRVAPGKQRRAPQGGDLKKLLRTARRRATIKAKKVRAGGPIVVVGVVRVSKDTRRRTIRGELSRECRETIAQLLLEDLCDEAVETFEECFGQENGMTPGYAPSWVDVGSLNL